MPPTLLHRSARGSIALAVLLLTGCSGVGLAYNNADHLMLKRLERFVELEQEQRDTLAGALEIGLERHRREDLPVLLARLREVRAIAAGRVDRDSAARALELGQLTYRETAAGLITDIAPVLATLDAVQIEALEARITEESAETRAKRTDENRADRMIDGIEKWTGRLNAAQRGLVSDAQRKIPRRSAAWHAFSEVQAARLVAELRAGANARAVERRLRAWWIEDDERDPAFRSLTASAVDGWIELLVRLDATLDERQRDKAVSKLDGWLRGLEKITVARS